MPKRRTVHVSVKLQTKGAHTRTELRMTGARDDSLQVNVGARGRRSRVLFWFRRKFSGRLACAPIIAGNRDMTDCDWVFDPRM
eukprot:626849-Pleurochrysis_carterae.AAC.1